MSIVRENMMQRKGYTPYCGNDKCKTIPRTRFNGKQFVCQHCGWKSQFEQDFIAAYVAKQKEQP